MFLIYTVGLRYVACGTSLQQLLPVPFLLQSPARTRGDPFVLKKNSSLDLWKVEYSLLLMLGISKNKFVPLWLVNTAILSDLVLKINKNYIVNLEKEIFKIFSSLNLGMGRNNIIFYFWQYRELLKKLLDLCAIAVT